MPRPVAILFLVLVYLELGQSGLGRRMFGIATQLPYWTRSILGTPDDNIKLRAHYHGVPPGCLLDCLAVAEAKEPFSVENTIGISFFAHATICMLKSFRYC